VSSAQKRSKAWGYEVEVSAVAALQKIFPGIRRTGSVAYKKAAADLVQDGDGLVPPLHLVVTRDKRRPLLVTLPVDDLLSLTDGQRATTPVYVQVKGRERTWIGRLYDELREATRD
jgi:hypothetical protein